MGERGLTLDSQGIEEESCEVDTGYDDERRAVDSELLERGLWFIQEREEC